ncbi:MAG TPA: alpha/beta hydrolase [Vicinamibacterales bacterium]|nr:alpha/beta hydrolase [Vicinamibacterales bacterium]
MARPPSPPLMTWMLVPAIALCLIAIWIVLPPFHAGLLPLAVGAPEISPWLLLASLGVCAMTFNAAAVAPAARAAFAFAVVAALLSASPLARAPLTLASFDRAMEQGLGRDYLQQIPAATGAGLRAHALSPLDFVRGIARVDVLVRRGVEFASPGGVALTADVYRPPGAGPHPVLLQLYGGAWQRGAPADNASFATWFAARGYVVAAIDYRHAPAATWPAQIQDVRTALGWVLAHSAEYEADPSRIAFVGRSAGAQLALVAAYQSGAQLVRAVVGYYGPTDLIEGWREPPRPDPLDIRSILETYLHGTPDTAAARYHDASPVTYATSRVPPSLLVYGARDHIVAPRFGRELDERLREAGARSVLLEIPWAEHAFDAVPNGVSGQIALYYTERFLAWALR